MCCNGVLDEVSPVLVEVWAETTKEYGSLLTAARLNGNGAEGHTDPRASGGGSGVLSGVQNMREVRRDKRYGESGCFSYRVELRNRARRRFDICAGGGSSSGYRQEQQRR